MPIVRKISDYIKYRFSSLLCSGSDSLIKESEGMENNRTSPSESTSQVKVNSQTEAEGTGPTWVCTRPSEYVL